MRHRVRLVLMLALLSPIIFACSGTETTSPAPSSSAASSPSAAASGADTTLPAPSGAPAAGTSGGTLAD